MPKRRKAPKRAAAADSEDEAATEIHEPAARWGSVQQSEIDSEVHSKAQQLIDDLEATGQTRNIANCCCLEVFDKFFPLLQYKTRLLRCLGWVLMLLQT